MKLKNTIIKIITLLIIFTPFSYKTNEINNAKRENSRTI